MESAVQESGRLRGWVVIATDSAVLTVDEAAGLLRVNRKTLYDAIERGQVPGVLQVGRVIRIGRAALLAYLAGAGSPALLASATGNKAAGTAQRSHT